MKKRYTEMEISLIAKSAIGKTFAEIKKESIITIKDDEFNKGSFGHIIEKYLFGFDLDNFSGPDFLDAGIELKVTPYKKLKNGMLSAKERLVFNIIDYNTEYKNSFELSQFWFKNNKIQLLWYLYDLEKKEEDFLITHEKLLDLSLSEDLEQIKKDYYKIIEKIKSGKAEEISEGDTMYLGACTKGVSAKSMRSQPFSNKLAKQRAFSFKNSYMTQLVRKYIGDYSDVEKILKEETSFDEYVSGVINKYIGKNRADLIKMFNIESSSKNINGMIISSMFNISGNLGNTEEFLKANIIPKTIRIEENNKIKESMSFPAFKYTDIIKETWDESELREMFETTKFMFFIFHKKNKDYVFEGIKLWNMPESELDSHVKEVWEHTVKTIKEGNIVSAVKNKKRFTNFISKTNNKIVHVRPHARNKKDVYKLPVADKLTRKTEYTKHCFWLNNDYVLKIITEFE